MLRGATDEEEAEISDSAFAEMRPSDPEIFKEENCKMTPDIDGRKQHHKLNNIDSQFSPFATAGEMLKQEPETDLEASHKRILSITEL